MIIQFPLTPIPHLLATYEVQKEGFVERAIWVPGSSEHIAVFSVPAGWVMMESSFVWNS